MGSTNVILRDMRPEEFDAYIELHFVSYPQAAYGTMAPEAARERVRQDLDRFLPDGLATDRHRILVAEDEAGTVVGYAWLGLDEPRTGSSEMAWLYDLRVLEPYRRRGYARAIMTAVEELAERAGARRLGLNVFGDNAPAIALYESRDYRVTTQQMAKDL